MLEPMSRPEQSRIPVSTDALAVDCYGGVCCRLVACCRAVIGRVSYIMHATRNSLATSSLACSTRQTSLCPYFLGWP